MPASLSLLPLGCPSSPALSAAHRDSGQCRIANGFRWLTGTPQLGRANDHRGQEMRPGYSRRHFHEREAMMPEFPAITHVALTVSDLGRSRPWYERLFGSDPVLDEDTGPFHHVVWLMGGTLVGIHQFPDLKST